MHMQQNKSQFKRLMKLVELIRDTKHPVNGLILSADGDWGVSQKTVQRDIEFLRDQMGAPIAYDRVRKSYYFTEHTWSMPAMLVSEGEILAVLLGSQVLEQYHGTPVAGQLGQVFNKLAALLPDKVRVVPENLFSRFTFRGPPAKPVMPEVWSAVIRGLCDQKTLRLRYRPFEVSVTTTGKESLINPLHVANLLGEWYLFGVHAGHNDVRQFSMARIECATLTAESFVPPTDFDPQLLLSGVFGRYAGGKSQSVRLLFDKEIADWVTEREWNPDQKVVRRRNGDIELSFPAKGLFEVQRWVLSWGRHVRVLAPTELRENVQEEIRLMAKTNET
jgi:proteasome accessory factor B